MRLMVVYVLNHLNCKLIFYFNSFDCLLEYRAYKTLFTIVTVEILKMSPVNFVRLDPVGGVQVQV